MPDLPTPSPHPDAYKPKDIAQMMEQSGVAKAAMPMGQMFVLAALAGAFIGFGAAGYTMVMTGADLTYGPARFLGGLVFSLGLVLVVVGGAELFTGNALMTMAAVDRKITPGALLRNWSVVWLGNLVGALGLAAVFATTGLYSGAMGETAVKIANAKLALSPLAELSRAILCNALVCLAVWLAMSSRDTTGKILAILFPIPAFVLLGLEHSVANMFFLPQSWAAGGTVPLGAAVQNLVLASLGNTIGGAGGVALAYRFAYLGSR